MRIVRAQGDAHARGMAIGRGFAEDIARAADSYRAYFARRDVEGARMRELAAPFVRAGQTVLPQETQMLRGMAEGAGVPFLDLFVPNAFEELEPFVRGSAAPVERCTDISIVGPGITLLGHNENWLAADAGMLGIVVDVPPDPDAVSVVSATGSAYLPAVGMNSAGYAQGVLSLEANDDGVGVPRVLVSRHVLDAVDRDDAVRRATVAPRSGGYAYSAAMPGGRAFTIETSATRSALIEGPSAHANHYVAPELAGVAAPARATSVSRSDRVAELAAERSPTTAEELMAMLADHDSSPAAVCLHPDPADGDDAESVLFSMVCDLEARRMWVAPGNPCTTPYEEIDLSDLASRPSSG
jgi:isopenicillin-N N-acyltransferase like protein